MTPATRPADILFMGRIFADAWGGVREMAESLLRAAAPLCTEQGRRIEVLVPHAGMCPVKHRCLKETPLTQFAGNRILWDHWTVSNYANHRPNAVLYNIKLVLPERLKIPGFTTIHDLMYFPQPHKYDWREYLFFDSLYMRLLVSRTVRNSNLTHVVSQYTAQDAAALFPKVDPSRFRPIYHGVDQKRWAPGNWTSEDERLWAGLLGRGLKEPYVFYSGGLSRRKNIRVLARAFHVFQRRHPAYQLVVTGGKKPTIPDPGQTRAINMIPRGHFLRLGTVTPRELALLYQRAAFFVFPSLYEGFGLPILEAQAAGCPVISSHATSLPEVARDSALLFDPRSPGELLDCMEQLTKETERRRWIAAGEENVKHFSWTETARQWLELVDEVARERGET